MTHVYFLFLCGSSIPGKLSDLFSQEIMEANDLDCNGCLTFDEFLMAMPANENISRDDHR